MVNQDLVMCDLRWNPNPGKTVGWKKFLLHVQLPESGRVLCVCVNKSQYINRKEGDVFRRYVMLTLFTVAN